MSARKKPKVSEVLAAWESVGHKAALEKIASMGHGMKESTIDWVAIGKNAVYTAQRALAGSCGECGQAKPYTPGGSVKEKSDG